MKIRSIALGLFLSACIGIPLGGCASETGDGSDGTSDQAMETTSDESSAADEDSDEENVGTTEDAVKKKKANKCKKLGGGYSKKKGDKCCKGLKPMHITGTSDWECCHKVVDQTYYGGSFTSTYGNCE